MTQIDQFGEMQITNIEASANRRYEIRQQMPYFLGGTAGVTVIAVMWLVRNLSNLYKNYFFFQMKDAGFFRTAEVLD